MVSRTSGDARGDSAQRLVDQPRRSLGGFALVAGEDVAVDLEGEGDVGVAEAFADHSRVLAHGEQVGGVGVPEAVEGEVADVEGADECGESLADVVGVVRACR